MDSLGNHFPTAVKYVAATNGLIQDERIKALAQANSALLIGRDGFAEMGRETVSGYESFFCPNVRKTKGYR